MQDLTRRMVKGAAWMVLAKVFDRSIGLVSTIILARLLLPADFGLVAMAMSILAALQLLGAFGFDMALIQDPSAGRKQYDTVWTIGILFAAFLAVALLLLAYPAGHFFNEPRLPPVMMVLAVMAVIGGFSNVGTVAFRKELQFDKEFSFTIARRVVLFVITVTLAYQWRDYWALVVGTMTATVIGVAISYVMHPYRPRLTLAAWRELFGYSRWVFINNTVAFLFTKAADFVVAKGAGTAALGQYSIASEISNLPSSELLMPINRALFPGYAKMSGDLGLLRRGYLNVVSIFALLAVPASVGLACVAGPLVNAFLGPNWGAVTVLVPVLAMHGLFTAINSCSHYVYLALGKPQLVTILIGAHVLIAIPLLALGVFYSGVEAAAWALLLATILMVPANYYLVTKVLSVRITDFAKVFWRPVLGAGVMIAVLVWLRSTLDFDTGSVGQAYLLVLLIGTGAVIYGLSTAVLWVIARRPDGAESFLYNQFIQRLRQLRS